eukprot:3816150-Lingulodinium_polyedra.AAC.1
MALRGAPRRISRAASMAAALSVSDVPMATSSSISSRTASECSASGSPMMPGRARATPRCRSSRMAL